jgi:cytochrome c-type biogenesis protein
LSGALRPIVPSRGELTVADSFTHAVTDGPLVVAAAVAAIVGVVGFLSPCVLPLVPGYLAFVSGLSGSEEPRPRRVVTGALLFVLGFSTIFVAGGLLFGQIGVTLQSHQVAIDRVLGTATIICGLVFLGQLPFLQRERRIHRLPPMGLLGAPLLGAAFGFSWAPCLTPTLGAVYSLSATSGTAGRGAFLTFVYCLGLGIPFVIVALGFGWVTRTVTFMRRHARALSVSGGVLLIAMGVLLVTGNWLSLMDWLRSEVGPGGFQI